MSRKSLLYLTQVESKGTKAWDKVDESKALALRSYFILQAMFFDKLLIGDSLLINVSYLRSLLWPEESIWPSVPADFAQLLDRGVIVAAVRDTVPSLHDVWADVVERGVSYAGSERYIRFLESRITKTNKITYHTSNVSALFRDNVLAALAPDSKLRLKKSVQSRAYDYVLSQEILYFIGMRQWMEEQVDLGRMTGHHKDVLESVLAPIYMHSLPQSIAGSQIDVPLDPKRLWTPIDIRLGKRSIVTAPGDHEFVSFDLRPFSINPRVLGALPAGTLLAIMADPTRRLVTKELAEFQRTGKVDATELAGHMEDFFNRAQELTCADVRGELKDNVRAARRSRAKTRLSIVAGLGLAFAGLEIWGAMDEVGSQIASAAGYGSLVFTAYASIDTLRGLGKDYRRGLAMGLEIPDEHRLVQRCAEASSE